MAIAIEYFAAAGVASTEGFYINISDLPGLIATDLEATDLDKESKVVRAILAQVYSQLTSMPLVAKPLGFTLAIANPVSAGSNLFNQSYLFSETRLANLGRNTLTVIPAPTTGEHSYRGTLGLLSIFPNGTLKAATVAVEEPGIIVKTAALVPYGGPTQEGIGEGDHRDWFTALITHIALDATRRSNNTPSAIVAASKVSTTILTPPPSFTAVDNPITGVLAAELPLRVFVTSTYSVTVQVQINPSMAPVNNVSA